MCISYSTFILVFENDFNCTVQHNTGGLMARYPYDAQNMLTTNTCTVDWPTQSNTPFGRHLTLDRKPKAYLGMGQDYIYIYTMLKNGWSTHLTHLEMTNSLGVLVLHAWPKPTGPTQIKVFRIAQRWLGLRSIVGPPPKCQIAEDTSMVKEPAPKSNCSERLGEVSQSLLQEGVPRDKLMEGWCSWVRCAQWEGPWRLKSTCRNVWAGLQT